MAFWLTLAGAVLSVFVAVIGGAISLDLWSRTNRRGFALLRRLIVGSCFGGLILAPLGQTAWSLVCQAIVVGASVLASAARSSLQDSSSLKPPSG
jgi:predicted acyltransferase